MTKKRSRRKRRKRGKRSSGKPVGGGFTPPIARTLDEPVAIPEPDYSEDNFIRILQHSAALRDEPEFSDLYLDPLQTLETATRHFAHFQRQVTRAMRQGREPVTDIYDEYRIAVLDDLDTPQLRQQLCGRLDRYIDRPKRKRGRDADKLESALFLRVLLDDKADKLVKGKKPLPLGVFALVTIMYEDSFDRAMQEIPTAREIVGKDLYEMWCAKYHDQDMEAIIAATERASTFDELAARVDANPDLALAWERQEEYLLDELESQVSEGRLTITPNPFTADDAVLAMDKMEQRYLAKPWHLSRYSAVLAMSSFAICIWETLDEIVSPQRVTEMIAEFESDGQECLESDDERVRVLAPHVLAAVHHLQNELQPARNQVVRMMFMSNFTATLKDMDNADTLSPRWQRFLQRAEKSRLLQRMTNANKE